MPNNEHENQHRNEPNEIPITINIRGDIGENTANMIQGIINPALDDWGRTFRLVFTTASFAAIGVATYRYGIRGFRRP